MQLRYLILILAIALSLKSHCQSSQSYRLTLHDINSGLSNRNVQSIQKDNQGLIWLGTKHGLNKFDGYNFKWFDSSNSEISSNEVNHLLKDQQGDFWLIDTDFKGMKSPNSIDIFNPITEEFSPLDSKLKTSEEAFLSELIAFNNSENGELIFLHKDLTVTVYDSIRRNIQLPFFEFDKIQNIYLSPQKEIWISYQVNHRDSKTVKINHFSYDGQLIEAYLPNEKADFVTIIEFPSPGGCKFIASAFNKVYEFYEIKNNKIQVDSTTKKQLEVFDMNYKQLADISNIEYNRKHGLWGISIDEFIAFNEKSGTFLNIDEYTNYLKTVTEIFIENKNRMWVCTQFGLIQLDINDNKFLQVFNDDPNNPYRMRGLVADDYGRVWAMRENVSNVYRIENLNQGVRQLKNPQRSFELKYEAYDINTFSYAIGRKRNGTIIYFSANVYHEHNPVTDEIIETKYDGFLESDGAVWAIYEDANEIIWIATDGGEVAYIDADKKLTVLPKLEESDNLNYCYQFFEDDNDQLWLATQSGLYTIDKTTKTITDRYWTLGKNNKNLPTNNIQHVYVDQETGLFWLATGGQGLIKWNPETSDYQQFTRVDGLSNDNIYAVYEDTHGQLWLSSDYGIMRFDKNDYHVMTFLERDGITHNEFNRISHCQTTNGLIVFGGLRGINVINPYQFQRESRINSTPLVITNFSQFDGNQQKLVDKTTELRKKQKITMESGDPFSRIEFSLLNYESSENNNYAFIIEGIYNDWQYINENFIQLNRLPYGNYILRIKGQNIYGEWSDNELRIELTILKPFYFKAWFILLIIAFLISGVLGFARNRTRQLQYQKAKLQSLVNERTETIQIQNAQLKEQAHKLKALGERKSQFFANVSHELRTPLTILLGPIGSVLKSNQLDGRNTTLLKKAQESGKGLLSLINQILDLSKLEFGELKLEESPVKLYDFIRKCFVQFEGHADLQNIKFILDYQFTPDTYLMMDKTKLRIVINNYLSNALKFTPDGGTVILKVHEKESTVLISVKDNGSGIHPKDLPHIFDRFYQSIRKNTSKDSGTGIGLAIVNEYANLMNGKAWVNSIYSEGAEFLFEFPKKVVVGQIQEEKVVAQSETLDDYLNNLGQDENADDMNAEGTSKLQGEILIVEDNPTLRNYLELLLQKRYKVNTSKNGREALTSLQNIEKVDLIISDIMMPEMDGFVFLENLKNDPKLRSLPVIMLTARADAADKLKALRIGVDDYIVKPFEEEELLIRVENIINNHKTRISYQSDEEMTQKNLQISEADQAWLSEVEEIALKGLEENILSVNWLAFNVHLSERQLRRKLLKLTGMSSQKYLNHIQLYKAKSLLEKGTYKTVSEVAYAVGFKDSSSFSRSYKRMFGKAPSDVFSSNS